MSYGCADDKIARIRYFSNPDVEYGGVKTGKEPEYEGWGPWRNLKEDGEGANNAKVIRDNMVRVSDPLYA